MSHAKTTHSVIASIKPQICCVLLSLLLLIVATLSACSRQPNILLIEGAAQGTRYHITYAPPQNTNGAPINNTALAAEIELELARIDKSISNYRADSKIEAFNSAITTDALEVSEEIVNLIEIAHAINKASNGCYDLTIKPLFDLWGFKKHEFSAPDETTLANTRALVGMDKLETIDKTHLRKKNAHLRIDLSSIGQGYSIGKIAALLEAHQITHYIVEIGGELKTRGKNPNGQPWRLALEKPQSNEQKIEKIAVINTPEPMSMMPSGTYHHYFDAHGKRYSHIFDARTGKPIIHNSASVTVFNPDPTLADAWSTALLCLGSKEGAPIADAHGIAALFIDQASDDTFTDQPTQSLRKLHAITLKPAHD